MSKLDDYNAILVALSTHDVPRLRQLLAQALKQNASIGKILRKLEDCIEGLYKARSFGAEDLDIALLVLRLGSRRLLFALSQHLGLPSVQTLRRHRAFTRIMPSFGTPTLKDFEFNLTEIFLSRTEQLDKARPFLSGMKLMWDEVALEETGCYFRHANCVGGFCREHSCAPGVNLRLSTEKDAEAIADRLNSDRLHLGKEASVLAFGSFGTILRGAFPACISPTCKSETPEQSARLAQTAIEAWNKTAAPFFGPVWSISGDGDGGRRAMNFILLMKYEIDELHVLYKYLGDMPGLNLWVGDGDITADIDWKHEIKRT